MGSSSGDVTARSAGGRAVGLRGVPVERVLLAGVLGWLLALGVGFVDMGPGPADSRVRSAGDFVVTAMAAATGHLTLSVLPAAVAAARYRGQQPRLVAAILAVLPAVLVLAVLAAMTVAGRPAEGGSFTPGPAVWVALVAATLSGPALIALSVAASGGRIR